MKALLAKVHGFVSRIELRPWAASAWAWIMWALGGARDGIKAFFQSSPVIKAGIGLVILFTLIGVGLGAFIAGHGAGAKSEHGAVVSAENARKAAVEDAGKKSARITALEKELQDATTKPAMADASPVASLSAIGPKRPRVKPVAASPQGWTMPQLWPIGDMFK